MPRNYSRGGILELERLEERLQLSMAIPENSIGMAAGNVAAPGELTATSVTVAPKNITKGKPSTLLGVFVQPEAGSSIAPRIVAVEGSNGQRLSLKQGRPYVAGRDSGQAAAFVKVSQPGALTILVTGSRRSTGQFGVDATLVGDVNGDGTVNEADLQPFALAYETTPGNPKYDLAADFNHDGIVNQIDAKALMKNMTPVTPNVPLQVVTNLIPADQARYATSQNSGGTTFDKTVTIEGHTMPGSIVLEDNSNAYYKWDGGAVATNADGDFTATETNKDGINTYNFLIIDPYGRQLIRTFPVFWIPFAAAGSTLK